jgi:ABC-type sulfate/molybdate transport systems ATPase subunit
VALLSVRFALPRRSFSLELSLETEGVTALVGPSGAGKSSVLSVVAGLVRPPAGRVALDDEVWFDAERGIFRPPDRRRVGLVFQEYALFPHMTVRQNVAYGGANRADELMERLHIGHLAAARPEALSGGERQRVAVARALAREPGVLLLDEPLSALDAHTKGSVRDELAGLLTDLGLPTLVVTHDYDDAVALAETVGVLVAGELRQLGSPAELLRRPADAFVASFTGGNLLRGRAVARRGDLTEVALESGGAVYSTDEAHGDVDVVIHPWEVSLALDGEPADGGTATRSGRRSGRSRPREAGCGCASVP